MHNPRAFRAPMTLFMVGLATATGAAAQDSPIAYEPPATDVAAVRQAVMDYVEALYLVDTSRITRSVSRGLAKIGIGAGSEPTNRMTQDRMTFEKLHATAAEWNEDGEVPADAIKEVVVFEVLDYTASVKLVADWGIDYMHLAKYGDRWLIVNVIYQRHPGGQR